MTEAIVVGAGAAGLGAAFKLAEAGISCVVLEARDRIGGRIYTVPENDLSFELGAEFVHGAKNIIWQFAQPAALGISELPDQHWIFARGKLRHESNEFWSELDETIQSISSLSRDCSFDEFLQRRPRSPREWLLRQYVEGFYAADTRQISAKSLLDTGSSADEGVNRTFRVQHGYSRLHEFLLESAEEAGAEVYLETRVERVHWRPGQVEVFTISPEGQGRFVASGAVITVPISLLRPGSNWLGRIHFEPELIDKQPAIDGLAMGQVMKLSLLFDDWFWQTELGVKDFGFIHVQNGWFPTWWSNSSAPILVAWVGGPNAQRLQTLASEQILEHALQTLGPVLGHRAEHLRRFLTEWYWHSWSDDPFSAGAYSYPTVCHAPAAHALNDPIEQTLFFAGEATMVGSARGTVHGALASGFKAAEQVLHKPETALKPSF